METMYPYLRLNAAIHPFGLVCKKESSEYAISENAYKITDPLTDDEKQKELKEAVREFKIRRIWYCY